MVLTGGDVGHDSANVSVRQGGMRRYGQDSGFVNVSVDCRARGNETIWTSVVDKQSCCWSRATRMERKREREEAK